MRLRQIDRDTVAVEGAATGAVLVEAKCPHRGGLLRYGHVDRAGSRLVCPLHRSVFGLADGAQLAGPPCRALRVRPEE